MLVTVGSRGLMQLGINLTRKPKDWDFIGYPDDVYEHIKQISSTSTVIESYPTANGHKHVLKTESGIYEYELAWPCSTGEEFLRLWSLCSSNQSKLCLLYALKKSHRFLKDSPHFLKTMRDMQMMSIMGAHVMIKHSAWLKEREKATYKNKLPVLNVKKDEFFKMNQGVDYIYDHDDIHKVMAIADKPAYTYFKDEQSEVFCSEDKFWQQHQYTRLNAVLEESYVLALERSQIPYKAKGYTAKWSFNRALEKVCTSITSGWFREFAYNNYDRVCMLYDDRYVERFWTAVEQGKVRKLEKVNA